jgi:hypothetical protein
LFLPLLFTDSPDSPIHPHGIAGTIASARLPPRGLSQLRIEVNQGGSIIPAASLMNTLERKRSLPSPLLIEAGSPTLSSRSRFRIPSDQPKSRQINQTFRPLRPDQADPAPVVPPQIENSVERSPTPAPCGIKVNQTNRPDIPRAQPRLATPSASNSS